MSAIVARNEKILSRIESIGGDYVWDPECFSVTLSDVPVTDGDISELSELRGVQKIILNAANLSYQAIEAVARIPDLKSLVLCKDSLTAEQVIALRSIGPQIQLGKTSNFNGASKKSGGMTIRDPAGLPAHGDQLHFKAPPLIGDIPEGIGSIENWEYFDGMIASVCFYKNGITRIEGSAVIVAPGIALAATHVIQPHWDSLNDKTEQMSCYGITPHGLRIWAVRNLTLVSSSDIAILSLELNSKLPPNNTFVQAKITTRMPAIGERLKILGFRASAESFQVKGSETVMGGAIFVSHGTITNRYPRGRDRSMIPWPVIEINSPAHGGMSGGPAFDKNGLLVGLLCSSISTEEEGKGHSYVSLLWPALGTKFDGVWPVNFYQKQTSLLALNRACSIDKRDALIEKMVNGTGTLTYQSWEE